MNPWLIIIPAAIILVLFLALGYIKAPPDTAIIISGLAKKKRILIGRAGFRVPFFERIDRFFNDSVPAGYSLPYDIVIVAAGIHICEIECHHQTV